MGKISKTFALFLTLIMVMSCLTLLTVKPANAQTTLSIQADGTIYPSTAPIHRLGDLYVLTSDTSSLYVARSNITIDGAGHTIRGLRQSGAVESTAGINIGNVQNVTVKGFSIKDCAFGFSLSFCSNITILDNNITGTYYTLLPDVYHAGILIWNGDHIKITGNLLENNEYGIYLGDRSGQNIISDNTISGSNIAGIILEGASNNTFFHNNFVNGVNFYDSGFAHRGVGALSVNAWDNGGEGNFWSDYNGTDANGNGIGDSYYQINIQNVDNFPLVAPFNSTYYSLKITQRKISLISPINQLYNASSCPLVFTVDKAVNWTAYSLDGKDQVSIAGNTTLTDLPNGLHNVTLYAEDTFGNITASETISFVVEKPDSFLTFLAVAGSGASIVVIFISILLFRRHRKTSNLNRAAN